MARYALIAEPDPHRAASLLSLVTAEGLEGHVARDGEEAREAIQQRGAPTLLVTDLALPRLDGFALLTWLRERSDAMDTAAVVVTAFDELRVRAWQLKDSLGIHGLLGRRAPLDSVREAVRHALTGGPRSTEPPSPEGASEDLTGQRARLEALRMEDDLPPEEHLQELVTEVAHAFGVPVALLTLVLGKHQWFKAHVDLPASLSRERGAPRDWSVCHQAVQGREAMVVSDAPRHPVFRDQPLVREGVLGSFAGAPLVTAQGVVLGTLCVLDTRPLTLGPEDLAALRELAARVAGDLESRSTRSRPTDAAPARADPPLTQATALALVRGAVQALDVPALLVGPGRKPYAANSALAELLGLPAERLVGMGFEALCRHVADLTSDPSATVRQLDLASESSRGLHLTLALERPQPRVVRWVARPFLVPGGVAQLLSLVDAAAPHGLREERERLLRVDALTGLAQRRAGEERLLKEMGRCRREGLPISVVLVDLAGLGRLNAARGFDAGDAALRDVARRAEALCQAPAFGVRWEGGTLLLALPGVDAVGTEAVRQQLHDAPGGPGLVSAAVSLNGEEDPQGTLARAQTALAKAKAERRGRSAD
ncbi:diguanylate cyclase [Corallococcus sp. M34]|uniref:diguanylate cyclase domain-containing protein n=1 Tax=Citreicoccus inhibens TaxID=2849499 RepID=UPI001C213EDF|nr:diguanylate cyclase [Citreicoccus inhibens]MBU8898536.1 diguanylate cyclase [Citreicoccus inhibens]